MQAPINYGPLADLIGQWQGETGVDISPEEVGEERNLYRETLVFEPARDVSNAEEQELVVLHYHQMVVRLNDQKLIHNECGYYAWDEQNQQLIKSFSIPRGVAVVAGGGINQNEGAFEYEVSAGVDDPDWPIAQTTFMRQKAQTKTYQFRLDLNGDELRYRQSMLLQIFGREFEHTDENRLHRVVI